VVTNLGAPGLLARSLRPCLLLVLALVLGLAATLVPAAAPPAAAEPLFASATTAYTTISSPVHGQRFKIVGQVFLLLGDSPAPLPNQKVTLEQRLTGSTTWAAVATATTTETTMPNGEKQIMYTFNRVAYRTVSFRVRYAGSPDSEAIAGSASDDGALNPVPVRVRRQMPIRLLQPRPSRIFLSGTAKPLFARQRVVVLRKTCATCAWKVYARPLTNAKGSYRVRLNAPLRGSYYYVARARASQGFVLSPSQQARIRTR
jgi:hypothetical protein